MSKAKPAPVKVGAESLVRTSTFAPDRPLPLVVEPAVERLRPEAWFAENRGFVEEKLALHGGLLFRGFRLETVADFDAVVEAVATERMEYKERSTPRSTVAGKIYTSTEYAADQHIPMHNENSYSHVWPRRIWFFCVQPSATGGETPLADSRTVYGLIPPEVREAFTEKRVMYVRNYGQGLDLSWQDAFQTTDREAVGSYCRKSGIDFTWKGGDRLTTRQVRQGVAVHPATGESVWFNQAHLFHVSSLPPALRESLLKVVAEEDLPRNACFGDGSAIDPEMLEAVRAAYRQAAVSFPWQRGDLLLLDNMRVAHGRAPYTGARQIVVAMSEPYPPGATQAAEQA